jgi:hypothetical protein
VSPDELTPPPVTRSPAEAVPAFSVAPEIALQLLMAANFLDC